MTLVALPAKAAPDACAAASGARFDARMHLLGRRWVLPVLLALSDGPQRFGALRGRLRGISANVLSQRLRELEAASLVRHVDLPPPASVPAYQLDDDAPPLHVMKALDCWIRDAA